MNAFKDVNEYILDDLKNPCHLLIGEMKKKFQDHLDSNLINSRVVKYKEFLLKLGLVDFGIKKKPNEKSLAFIFNVLNYKSNEPPYHDKDMEDKTIKNLIDLNFEVISRKTHFGTQNCDDKKYLVFPSFKDFTWTHKNTKKAEELVKDLNINGERLVVIKFDDKCDNHIHLDQMTRKKLCATLEKNIPNCLVCQSIDIRDFCYINQLSDN